jgi:hypothetical protein
MMDTAARIERSVWSEPARVTGLTRWREVVRVLVVLSAAFFDASVLVTAALTAAAQVFRGLVILRISIRSFCVKMQNTWSARFNWVLFAEAR